MIAQTKMMAIGKMSGMTNMKKLLILFVLCAPLSAQTIVATVPFVTAEDTAAVGILYDNHTWVIAEIQGPNAVSPIDATGSGPGGYSYTWTNPANPTEIYEAKQDCKSMTVANCLKAFLEKVKALKAALGIP